MTLTARLSAFFLGALALVLLGFSLTLYLLARAYLHRQTSERLDAALDTLAAAAEIEGGRVEWEPDQHQLARSGGGRLGGMRWAVHDDQGNLVDHSDDWHDADFAAPPTPDVEAISYRTRDEGERWRWQRRPVVPEGPGGGTTGAAVAGPHRRYAGLVLTVGLSMEPVRTDLQRLAIGLTGVSLVLWLGAAALGRWLCRRALRPLTAMAGAAQAFDARDLSQRLPEPRTRDEVGDLGRSFNGLLARLEETFERQRRFTGDASHELRTPLAALRGQVEVALRRDRPTEDYRDVLAQVHGQAIHLQDIVEALLFLARADSEAVLDRLERIDLARWLPEHATRWTGHARAADLRLEIGTDTPLLVNAQETLLGQLLDNLVENAWKYSRPGTPVAVQLEATGGHVLLTVEDQGSGISPADLPHVFDPFYRAAAARQAGKAGAGLGLAVCRRIATALGGDLTARSEPGVGSRFMLRLPLAEEQVHGAGGADGGRSQTRTVPL
jgi:heavy metal sensor kinase